MASNSFKKLPAEVRRELLRHVKPTSQSGAIPSASAISSKQKQQNYYNAINNSTRNWLIGCIGFVGFAASLPYWATQTIGNLTDREDALNASQIRRGAFSNSGSQDVGKDPNWDWKHGRYVYPKGFAEHLKKQNPNDVDLGPDIGPAVAEEKRKGKTQLDSREIEIK